MDGRLVAWGIAIVFVLVVAAIVAVGATRRRRASRVLSREELLRRARIAGRQVARDSRSARRGSIRGKGGGGEEADGDDSGGGGFDGGGDSGGGGGGSD